MKFLESLLASLLKNKFRKVLKKNSIFPKMSDLKGEGEIFPVTNLTLNFQHRLQTFNSSLQLIEQSLLHKVPTSTFINFRKAFRRKSSNIKATLQIHSQSLSFR